MVRRTRQQTARRRVQRRVGRRPPATRLSTSACHAGLRSVPKTGPLEAAVTNCSETEVAFGDIVPNPTFRLEICIAGVAPCRRVIDCRISAGGNAESQARSFQQVLAYESYAARAMRIACNDLSRTWVVHACSSPPNVPS